MGRTIPSFRIALAMEKEEWKPFRNALSKSDRKRFDDMFDIPRLYTSACSYAVQPIRLYPILMSILLYHFKELTECIEEVERIEAKVRRQAQFSHENQDDEDYSKEQESEGGGSKRNTYYYLRWLFYEIAKLETLSKNPVF